MDMEVTTIDETLNHVGQFGFYQWFTCFLCAMINYAQGMTGLMMYFVALSPQWECTKNSTICNSSEIFPSYNNWRCSMNRSDWKFTDPKTFSITTQFDLVCENSWIISLTSSLYFAGSIITGTLIGWTTDRLGRKNVCFISLAAVMIIGSATAFCKSIIAILVMRFATGLAIPGTTGNAFVLLTESVGIKYRNIAGQMIFLAWPIAQCVLALTAYLIAEWKILVVLSTAPYISVLLGYFFMPESLRWLQVHGKTDRLNDTFKKIAKWNRTSFPQNIVVKSNLEGIDKKVNPLYLFKTKKQAISTCVQIYAWFTFSLVYFGLSLGADNLAGSVYLNFVLIHLVEVPAVLSAMYFPDKFGRKKTIIISLLSGSLACIIVSFYRQFIAIAVLGKFFVTISFCANYSWSAELFPTKIRGEAIGLFNTLSRIGSAGSPFISKTLAETHKSAPFLAMGIIGVVCFFLLFVLPETKHKENHEKELNENFIDEKHSLV